MSSTSSRPFVVGTRDLYGTQDIPSQHQNRGCSPCLAFDYAVETGMKTIVLPAKKIIRYQQYLVCLRILAIVVSGPPCTSREQRQSACKYANDR
jgi:hypothetical protein